VRLFPQRMLWDVAAQQLVRDVDVLNFALWLEHLSYAFYRDGIGHFTFGTDSRGKSIDDHLVIVRDQESAHVTTLTQAVVTLGGSPAAESTYDFGDAYDDLGKFLETAMALENLAVSAYYGAAPMLSDPDLLATAGSIVAVEARHASYLTLLNGQVPFPDAFETPIAPETVLEIVRPLTVA
jgi:rubrerythrin